MKHFEIGSKEDLADAAWEAYTVVNGPDWLKNIVTERQDLMDPIEASWKLGFCFAVFALEHHAIGRVGKDD